MVTFITCIYAKPGRELAVTQFYQDQAQALNDAKGYRSRQILRARPGTVEAELRRVMPPEQLKGSHEHEGPAGVHFVIIEHWDSVQERVAFTRTIAGDRGKGLFPHLLPEHSHEFSEDVTTA